MFATGEDSDSFLLDEPLLFTTQSVTPVTPVTPVTSVTLTRPLLSPIIMPKLLPRPILMTPPSPIASHVVAGRIYDEKTILFDIVQEHLTGIEMHIDRLLHPGLLVTNVFESIMFFSMCIIDIQSRIANKINSLLPAVILLLDLSVIFDIRNYIDTVNQIVDDTKSHTIMLIKIVPETMLLCDLVKTENNPNNLVSTNDFDNYFIGQLDTRIACAVRIDGNIKSIVGVFQWIIISQ